MARDLARTHTAVMRAQKLASIGQVAAGVAHEINNPLGIILGYVKTMRRREGRDDEGLKAVEDEATQCRRIVQGLLDLARPDQLSLEPCDVASVLRDVVSRFDAAGQLGRVPVTGPESGQTAVVPADPGRLRQVFVNVIANAVDASQPVGPVHLSVERDDSHVVVNVRDFGAGIPAEVRARLFEPFLTTKREGVGLGLAIAHAIVDAHGGTIGCESPEGGGTLVKVRIPATGPNAGKVAS